MALFLSRPKETHVPRKNFHGKDREQFLDFLARVLTWLSEDWFNSFPRTSHHWLT